MNDKVFSFSPLAALMILVVVIFGVFLIPDNNEAEPVEHISHKPIIKFSFTIPMPNEDYIHECIENRAKAKLVIYRHNELMDTIDSLEIPTCKMVLKSLGTYYITGYTSWELNGSVQTASGAICHKADSIEDSLNNPTTCAADVWGGYHEFGDILFLEDFGYFIVEDTGSAVLGKHIDLYYGLTYEDNQEALTITGYYEVFSVEYVYGSEKASKYDITELVWEAQNETN